MLNETGARIAELASSGNMGKFQNFLERTLHRQLQLKEIHVL